MKWCRVKKDNLTHDNRGSTIIVVLVTMTFLTVLASILLYLSLVNLQMKKMDKSGKVNFYSAEAYMNEIRAGVQQVVSNAIKTAYTSVLVSYNTETEDDQIESFRSKFIDGLCGAEVTPVPLITHMGTVYSYNSDVLKSFVTDETVDVSQSGSEVVTILNGDGKITGLIIKDVVVSYALKGYETTVSSDIKIMAPELPYTSATMKQTTIPDFAIVANGTLMQDNVAGHAVISGSVYADDVNVGGLTFDVQNASSFISAKTVTVTGGKISFNPNSALWAHDIKLGVNGKIDIAGDAYIKNDLNLHGNNTQAVLTGRYYGYGNLPDPNNSSAIIINGRYTILDLSTRALMLAGHSYVNFNAGENGYVMMGESVSVKSNQLAYLVPEDCLKGSYSNPYQYTGELTGNETLANDAIDLSQKINGKALSEYGITSAIDNIAYIHKTVGDKDLIYFCFKFPTSGLANKYFKDYYNTNGQQILKYLDLYSNGVIVSSASINNLAGDAFTFNEGVNKDDDGNDMDDTLGAVIDASVSVSQQTIDEISKNYTNLCVTLSRTDPGSGGGTPYHNYVSTAEVLALPPGTQTFDTADLVPKAVVTHGNYLISAENTPGTVHIVIASGDVTVSRDFSGLILAGGNVRLNDNTVTAGRAAVADALQTLLTEDEVTHIKYYKFLNPNYISPLNISTNAVDGADIWDMNTLVIYENWAKNET